MKMQDEVNTNLTEGKERDKQQGKQESRTEKKIKRKDQMLN